MLSQRPLLLDTDVIIDYLKGYVKAVDFIENLQIDMILISAITVAELAAGIKNKTEEVVIMDFLNALEIIPVDTKIAQEGGKLRNTYKNSHGIGLADAIIAATAQHYNALIATLNDKHFKMMKSLLFRPYDKT